MNIHYHLIWQPTVCCIYRIGTSLFNIASKIENFSKLLNVNYSEVALMDFIADGKTVYMLEVELSKEAFDLLDKSLFTYLKKEDVRGYVYNYK